MEYRVEDNLSYKIHMIKTDKFKTVNIKIIFRYLFGYPPLSI